jgi:hypothetical protein
VILIQHTHIYPLRVYFLNLAGIICQCTEIISCSFKCYSVLPNLTIYETGLPISYKLIGFSVYQLTLDYGTEKAPVYYVPFIIGQINERITVSHIMYTR